LVEYWPRYIIYLARPGYAKRNAAEGGLMFCRCFFIFFSDFCQTNYSATSGPIIAKFARLTELRLQMNDLKLVVRPRNGRCSDNQFCGPNPQSWFHVRFARWRRTTRSASAALNAGEPVNWLVNSNQQAARGRGVYAI